MSEFFSSMIAPLIRCSNAAVSLKHKTQMEFQAELGPNMAATSRVVTFFLASMVARSLECRWSECRPLSSGPLAQRSACRRDQVCSRGTLATHSSVARYDLEASQPYAPFGYGSGSLDSYDKSTFELIAPVLWTSFCSVLNSARSLRQHL